jgi:hypothetical protein
MDEDVKQVIMTLARRIDALEAGPRDRPISFEVKVDKEIIKFYITGTDPVQDKQIIDNTYQAYNYAHRPAVVNQAPVEFDKKE